jgi:hypothetical protein
MTPRQEHKGLREQHHRARLKEIWDDAGDKRYGYRRI